MSAADDPRRAARNAAIALLAGREFSSRQLRERLLRRHDATVVDEVLAQLMADGLLSDERFAEVFTRSKAGRGFGPRRIAAELERNGFERSRVKEVLEASEQDWWQHLRELHQRRFGDTPPVDLKERARRTRFLCARGYSPAQVDRLLRSLGRPDELE